MEVEADPYATASSTRSINVGSSASAFELLTLPVSADCP